MTSDKVLRIYEKKLDIDKRNFTWQAHKNNLNISKLSKNLVELSKQIETVKNPASNKKISHADFGKIAAALKKTKLTVSSKIDKLRDLQNGLKVNLLKVEKQKEHLRCKIESRKLNKKESIDNSKIEELTEIKSYKNTNRLEELPQINFQNSYLQQNLKSHIETPHISLNNNHQALLNSHKALSMKKTWDGVKGEIKTESGQKIDINISLDQGSSFIKASVRTNEEFILKELISSKKQIIHSSAEEGVNLSLFTIEEKI